MRLIAVVVAVLMSTPAVAAAASPSEIDSARDQVIDSDFQAEMPCEGFDCQVIMPSDDDGEIERERERKRKLFDEQLDVNVGHSSVMSTVMWGLVIVFGLVVVLWAISEFLRRNDDARVPTTDAQLDTRVALLDRPLDDADELARSGAFADAIHVLLLRTLYELARSADVAVAPAMTSREILARVPLRAEARSALADLIAVVELTYFGDAHAGAGDYDRCRRQFHVFATAYGAAP